MKLGSAALLASGVELPLHSSSKVEGRSRATISEMILYLVHAGHIDLGRGCFPTAHLVSQLLDLAGLLLWLLFYCLHLVCRAGVEGDPVGVSQIE